jgi:hypothetical protein
MDDAVLADMESRADGAVVCPSSAVASVAAAVKELDGESGDVVG